MQSAYMIGNRYQILDKIDEGGMGTVFKGLDTHSNESVAVKLLKPNVIANDPDMLERFQREGEALRELNHPNIVKMLDTIEDEGKHYLVMEYVSGGDLSDLLQQGQMPIQRILEIAIDLADALTRTHKLSIIHRDLKPANMLIADDGTLRLTDFGIAHVTGKQHITETNAVMGTVPYMSPEILDGKSIDHRADIWAFGIILFEMLAVERPFTGDSPMAVIRSIVTDPIPDLEQLNPDCPIALVDLVYRMLEKDRNARIRSVRYVGAELEDILKGVEPSGHKPPAQSYETRRFDTPTPGYDERPKHNLPAQTTPFVGREHEIDELSRLIDNPDVRLITVLAPGGMGKSRLALAVGEQYIGTFTNGVYFAELAPLSSADNIPSAIASATGYQFQPDQRPPKQQIIDYLTHKHMLLIMDNYEHLLEGANFMTDILQSASDVTIVATSRQRLSQQAETLFHLSGMDFPEWETPDDALQYAAVKLFVNSAKRARPDFELTTDNMDFVARICKLVQGMPLGIVLAASWSGMLTAEEIAEELTQNLDFLETDESDLPERHRSMRAVIDYSWQQMTEAEQQVFMKLSVFRGGFTREAAQEVAGANLRVLISLVNKSLIRRDIDSGRYEIHELLRQYAEEKLRDVDKFIDINNAHTIYFAKFVNECEKQILSEQQLRALDELDKDFENIKMAWHRAVDNRNFIALGQFAKTIYTYAFRSPHEVELSHLLLTAIRTLKSDTSNFTEDHDIVFSKILSFGAHMNEVANADSVSWMEESLALARKTKDEEAIGIALYIYGRTIMSTRSQDAQVILKDGLILAKKLNDTWLTFRCLFALKYALYHSQKVKNHDILEMCHDLYDIALLSGDRTLIALSHQEYSVGFFNLGEYELALDHAKKALVNRQQLNAKGGIVISLRQIGRLELIQGHYAQAGTHFREGLTIAQEYSSDWQLEFAFENMANYSSLIGKEDDANNWIQQIRDLQITPKPNVLHTQGMVNYRFGKYQQAKKQFQLAIEKWDIRTYHIFVGLVECKLQKTHLASRHLYTGLKAAHSIQDVNWMPHAVYGFALVLNNNQQICAVELAALVEAHKATEYEVRLWAKDLLDELKSEHDEKVYETAYVRGKQLDLDTIVQELLEDFSSDEV